MTSSHQAEDPFDPQDRNAIYKTIFSRRDVRGQFKPDPIPNEILSRILYAAHHAPSVGFMQPWNFILIQSMAIREQVHAAFTQAHQEAVDMFPEDKRETYRGLKLEGILESPLNICLTCDRERTGPTVIGRTHIPAMDTYSSVCAVQNLWLAARAEGLGVGWVSIIHEEKLKKILHLPDHIIPIAYLCIGEVTHFYQKPELETAGWLPRIPLDELVRQDQWDTTEDNLDSLREEIKKKAHFPQQATQTT